MIKLNLNGFLHRQLLKRILPNKKGILPILVSNFSNTKSPEVPEISQNFPNVLSYLRETGPLFASSKSELDKFLHLLDSIESSSIVEKLENVDPRKLNEEYSGTITAPIEQYFRNRSLLEDRRPLPIQTTQAMLFPDMNLPNRKLSKPFIIEYISVLVLSFIDYHLNPSKDKIMGSYRIPGQNGDTIIDSSDSKNSKFTIVIGRNCNHFLLELEPSDKTDGKLSSQQPELYAILCETIKFILDYKDQGSIAFGALSTLSRVDASFGYRLLLNQSGLDRLLQADLLLNIDHISTDEEFEILKSQPESSRLQLAAKQILHSNLANVGNRWFDKSIQLIVMLNEGSDQMLGSGVCFESTLVRSAAIVDLIEHGVQFLAKFQQPNIENNSETLLKLHKIDLLQPERKEMIKSTINEFALKRYQPIIESNLNLQVLCFNGYGRELIESLNCSTDSWIQTAINLAYFNCLSSIDDEQNLEKFCTRFQLNNNNNNDFDSIQSFNQEFFEFLNDQQSEPKLRLALESLEFYLGLVREAKGQQSMDAVLRGYLNYLKQQQSLSESEFRLLKQFELDPIFNRSFSLENSKILTTPVLSKFDSLLLVKGCFPFNSIESNQSYRICYNLSEHKVQFVIVSNQENSENTTIIDCDQLQTELNQALIAMKSVMIG